MYTHGTPIHPRIELVAVVAVAGLPAPVTSHRYDSLWGSPVTPAGRTSYPLPRSADPLPADLLADAAGPVLTFLTAADGLAEFVLWAEEVFVGWQHPAWSGRFSPGMRQGTAPLQAAAFAAALLRDEELVEFLTARVENEEPNEHHFDDFLAEIRQFYPHLRHRHPTMRPVRW